MSLEGWVSVASATVAGLSALFTWLQVREARKARVQTMDLANAQAEAAKRSAEASERSAHAAEESAAVARNALEVGQRAWITISVVETKAVDQQSGSPLQVEVVLHNGGKTPAFEATCQAWLDCLAGLPSDLNFGGYPLRDLGAIGPGSTALLPVTLNPGSREMLMRARSGLMFVYLAGIVKYSDVFGNQHGTAWMYVYSYGDGRFFAWAGERYNYAN